MKGALIGYGVLGAVVLGLAYLFNSFLIIMVALIAAILLGIYIEENRRGAI